MANKTLKSIKFPDLADTYVIPQVDSTLAISGRPADSKSTGDALALKADASALSDYAKTDGLYEDMTVGNAEQLVGTTFEEDKVPYNFRTSGGSLDIGDREYDEIVGGTIAWNSLVKNGNFTNDNNWSGRHTTISVSGNVLTATVTSEGTQRGIYQTNDSAVNSIIGHKYLITCEVMPPADGSAGFSMSGGSGTNFNVTANVWNKCEVLWTRPNTEYVYNVNPYLLFNGTLQANAEIKYRNAFACDLTQMFGSTIADYIYSLEQGTAGAGVAWFKKLFPKPYYAYNAGELKSVSGLVSHDMVGFNAFSDTFVIGKRWDDDGAIASTSDKNACMPNKIKCLPNTEYCFSLQDMSEAVILYVSEWDGGENHIQKSTGVSFGTSPNYKTFTTGANTHYIAISLYRSGNYFTASDLEKANLNISWDGSRDGEYEPYELHSYPLDTDLTLRGIPKLDANNSLYYDGDVYEADGTVNRKYGIVNLGSLDWTYQSTYQRFVSATVSNIKTPSDNYTVMNIICAKYLPTYSDGTADSSGDKKIAVSQSGALLIRDEAYSDATAFKTAMSGVYCVYELATPTTEEADAYQTPQIVNDFGTEEFVLNNSIVPVGHDTNYQANLVAKLEMMPNSPSGNGDYIVRQTSGENSYVAITDNSVIDGLLTRCPAASGEDGTYVLKATISDGTATYAWVAE